MRTSSSIKLVNTNDPMYNKLTVGEGGNRIPTKTSVSRLAESIKKNNLLEYRPILVWKEDKRKENYVIIDGQTRYMACCELKEPFYMQEMKNNKRKDLLGILSVLNTNHWANKNGTRTRYKRYLTYHAENKVTHGILITIYEGETKRKGRNIEFKNGKLKDSPAILKDVEEALYKLRQLEYAAFNPALLRTTLRKQQFQSAMLTAFNTPEFNFNKFLKNLYDTRHCFNKLEKAIDMEKEIYRIESL